jgi:hypothetical protein
MLDKPVQQACLVWDWCWNLLFAPFARYALSSRSLLQSQRHALWRHFECKRFIFEASDSVLLVGDHNWIFLISTSTIILITIINYSVDRSSRSSATRTTQSGSFLIDLLFFSSIFLLTVPRWPFSFIASISLSVFVLALAGFSLIYHSSHLYHCSCYFR